MRFRLEGLEETVRNLGELPKATRRNVLRRVLKKAGQPIAAMAAASAPRGETGRLIGSIEVATQLTARQRRGAKVNEVEVYIGPVRRGRVLNYASFVEFGTIDTAAHPFMRPAWDSGREVALGIIKVELGREIEGAASRLARKAARAA